MANYQKIVLTKFYENRLGIDIVIKEKLTFILDILHRCTDYTLGSSGSHRVVVASINYTYRLHLRKIIIGIKFGY